LGTADCWRAGVFSGAMMTESDYNQMSRLRMLAAEHHFDWHLSAYDQKAIQAALDKIEQQSNTIDGLRAKLQELYDQIETMRGESWDRST
jgi:hypothetical protein